MATRRNRRVLRKTKRNRRKKTKNNRRRKRKSRKLRGGAANKLFKLFGGAKFKKITSFIDVQPMDSKISTVSLKDGELKTALDEDGAIIAVISKGNVVIVKNPSGYTDDQVERFGAGNIAKLDIKKIKPEQINKLSVEAIPALSQPQLANLTQAQLANLTQAQVNGLIPTQLAAFTDVQRDAFKAKVAAQ